MEKKIKTRLQLRDELATLFTIDYEHLPAKELLSEASAVFVVCAILYGLEKKDVFDIAGGAFDKLAEQRDQILSLHLPPPEPAEA